MYWSVSNALIPGILVRVRTALADLVAELITLTPQGQYAFGDITGNVAAGSPNSTQNYNAGFRHNQDARVR